MAINRRLKTVLLITFVVVGCSLLLGAGIKVALGILFIGGASAWAFGGNKGPELRESAISDYQVPQARGPFSKAVFCNFCGIGNIEESVFCRGCGREIKEPDFAATEVNTAKIQEPSGPEDQANSTVDEVASYVSAEGEHSNSLPPANENTPIYIPGDKYAEIGTRLAAYLADLTLIYLLYFSTFFFWGIFQTLRGASPGVDDDATKLLFWPVAWTYMIVSVWITHTTLGKYIFQLEIASASDESAYLSFGRIVLRESIGRLVSSIFFGIGYWKVASDPKKQAWSDKLARSTVRYRTTRPVLRRCFAVLLALALISDIGVYAWGINTEEHTKLTKAWQAKLADSGTRVNTAREAANTLINMQPKTITEWQNNMQRALGSLDAYERELELYEGVCQEGLTKGLTASELEKQQITVLIEIANIRKQQITKQREEANRVIRFNPFKDNVSDLLPWIESLDKEIAELNTLSAAKLAAVGIK